MVTIFDDTRTVKIAMNTWDESTANISEDFACDWLQMSESCLNRVDSVDHIVSVLEAWRDGTGAFAGENRDGIKNILDIDDCDIHNDDDLRYFDVCDARDAERMLMADRMQMANGSDSDD